MPGRLPDRSSTRKRRMASPPGARRKGEGRLSVGQKKAKKKNSRQQKNITKTTTQRNTTKTKTHKNLGAFVGFLGRERGSLLGGVALSLFPFSPPSPCSSFGRGAPAPERGVAHCLFSGKGSGGVEIRLGHAARGRTCSSHPFPGWLGSPAILDSANTESGRSPARPRHRAVPVKL